MSYDVLPVFDGRSEAEIGASLLLLDGLNCPVFMLRPNHQVLYTNSAAVMLMNTMRLVRVVNGKAVWRRSRDAQLIAAAIIKVELQQTAQSVCLLSRAGMPGFLLIVQPIPGVAAVMICVVDFNRPSSLAPGWSCAAFGFSRQSAELAESIAAGHTLAEFCLSSGVTLGAAKTRMKKILSVTDVRSQSALVAIMLRAASIVPMSFNCSNLNDFIE